MKQRHLNIRGKLLVVFFALAVAPMVAVGAASFVGPMYISELAPKKIRGGVTSFNQLMVVSGIFVSYIVNWAFGGAAGNWRWMLGLAALPGAALAIGLRLGVAYIAGVHWLHALKLRRMAWLASLRFHFGIVPVLVEHPGLAIDIDEAADYSFAKGMLARRQGDG